MISRRCVLLAACLAAGLGGPRSQARAQTSGGVEEVRAKVGQASDLALLQKTFDRMK